MEVDSSVHTAKLNTDCRQNGSHQGLIQYAVNLFYIDRVREPRCSGYRSFILVN